MFNALWELASPVIPAADVAYTPSGTIAATTVVGAIAELDSEKVGSYTVGITGADQITNIVSLTQAEYDAIVSKSATTLYVIVE